MSRLRVARRRVLAQVLLILTLLASGLVTPHPLAHADTQVGGPIISDTTWTLANSPYIVIENVDVWAGITLTIEPGVMVRFHSDKKIQINGTLVAQGTVSARITFTSNESSPQPGDWAHIEFTDTSADAVFDGTGNYLTGCVLQHCIVEYGGGDADGAIQSVDAAPLIDHCTVRYSDSRGLHLVGTEVAPAVARNNTVTANEGGGIYAEYATIQGNSVIENTALYENGGGVYVRYQNTVAGNTIKGNVATWGGGMATYGHVTGGAVTVEDNIIADNIAGVYGGGIYAYNYATLADNTVSGNAADTWGGGIYALYAVTITGNSFVENTASLGGGVNAGLGVDLVGNAIARNTASEQGSGVYYVGSGNVLSNTIVANTAFDSILTIGGVGIKGTPQLHYNSLYSNAPYDVVIVSSDDVSGTLNYWGTTSSVNILDQVYDWYDDSSRGKLLYIPYLQDPDPEAPVPPPLNHTADWHDGWVSLEWDPIPSSTTGYGYKVYYDSDSSGPPYDGTGLTEGDSPIDVGDLTAFALHGLEEDTAYYITITAYESLGREGWYSNEVNNLATLMEYVYLPLVLRGH